MSTENLYHQAAKDKIKKMAESINIAMMATNLGKKPLDVIPMATKKVDDRGNIWFISGKDSDHNAAIAKDKDVQLIYSSPDDREFLSVYGEAAITTNRELLEELYSKIDNNWFDGADDPRLSAIQFKPKEAYYWDTKNNKYVTLFKLGVSAVTGTETELGEKGKLKV